MITPPIFKSIGDDKDLLVQSWLHIEGGSRDEGGGQRVDVSRGIQGGRVGHLNLDIDCPQSIARCIFQLSRRDREFLSFSLMLQNEIENFCLSVSCFETRSRFSVFWSRASRRDREFLSFGLVLRDKSENSVFTLVIRDENENDVVKSTFVEGWLPFFSPVNS